eukprot:TRINITY_DN4556_c0_g1_i1.p1 TRINITY_DN4556_c0_g1~~TRINITY_DN4556_c0_g1_i1.p1  ORF type:complete len:110 (+),score=17.98 TRINITY_DN4556_c0_g1_i1:544-873(+)
MAFGREACFDCKFPFVDAALSTALLRFELVGETALSGRSMPYGTWEGNLIDITTSTVTSALSRHVGETAMNRESMPDGIWEMILLLHLHTFCPTLLRLQAHLMFHPQVS